MQEPAIVAPGTVSADDVEFYRRSGWVRIPSLLSRATVDELHTRWLEISDGLRKQESDGPYYDKISQRQHRAYKDPTKKDARFLEAATSPPVVAAAKALIGTETVRFLRATVFEKGRASEDNLPTTLHQDFPYLPLDRSGNIQIWIALTDVTASMGTLRFINGSHREWGSLGRVNANPEEQVVLRERLGPYELSEPIDLAAGDATVHHDLTIHGTDRNETEALRVGIALAYLRPDAYYTGAEYYATDGLGLAANQRLDSSLFPELG